MSSYIEVSARAGARRRATTVIAITLLLAAGACSPDRITNPNSPTESGVASNPLQALALAANGVLAGQRNSMGSYLIATGQFGRELFDISPTESRAVTYYYENFSDPTGGASSGWSDRYATLRNIATFYSTLDLVQSLTPAERSAALGFGKTLEGLELSHIIATRNNLGAVVEMLPDPDGLAPFVSRDSVYRYITAILDSGYADLIAAGSTPFPFDLPAPAGTGFSGFDTPAGFAKFNRALQARVQAYRASQAGGDEALYNGVLNALEKSFIRILSGQPLRTPADSDTPTDLRLAVYADATTPIPMIDNEELVLLRAEARWFTGDPGWCAGRHQPGSDDKRRARGTWSVRERRRFHRRASRTAAALASAAGAPVDRRAPLRAPGHTPAERSELRTHREPGDTAGRVPGEGAHRQRDARVPGVHAELRGHAVLVGGDSSPMSTARRCGVDGAASGSQPAPEP